jgi:alpha-L-arabinofuranosidase
LGKLIFDFRVERLVQGFASFSSNYLPYTMKKIVLFLSLTLLLSTFTQAQNRNQSTNRLVIHADSGKFTISKHIYGQFSEHLGRCIYGGIWVGEKSPIPNTQGYRNDVLTALKNLRIPNLRWPGGCFADEYHWMDGIGPKENRPKIVNTNWGGVVEDNSFGTHEFLNFCELIGTEPYLSANVGSGTVEEMAKWVEYVNSDGDSPMANLRRKNGRDKSWKVKFWGVGNESWGCGGNMTPNFYADMYKRYATYCRNYGENKLYKIASGASDYDFNWSEVLMKNAGRHMDGLSLHYYTVKGWDGSKGSATNFDRQEYIRTIDKCMGIEPVLQKHIAIMDQHDPQKKVGLLVDEWGTWWDVEPGTNPGFLYQQNTLRDAFVAATTLNIFHRYSDRIRMANLAQVVNVLQSLILTDNEKMVLTPTYHIFEMYKVHQEATYLPAQLTTEDYTLNDKKIPALNVSTSRGPNGQINISIVNVHPDKNLTLDCELKGASAKKVSGRMLTAPALNTHNTFDQPNQVKITDFNKAVLKNNSLKVEVPAKSVIVLTLN